MSLRRLAAASTLLLALGACAVGPPRAPERRPARTVPVERPSSASHGGRPVVTIAQPGIQDTAPDRDDIPADVANTPDAVPKKEPRSASGNPPEYEAFGSVYHVLDDTAGFTERGRASWYGKKFHGRKTASGEPYDMFAMTAAHKTLPIPSYVRVTNLDNGRTAVVRVNDRGPFHSGRIIDLSYAAAARLGIISDGHAEVRIEALQPDDAPTAVASAPPPEMPPAPVAAAAPRDTGRWLQIAAYSDPINAVAMRDELASRGLSGVAIREGGGALHRVVVGPFASEGEAQRTRDWLHDAGYAAILLKN